MDHGGILFSFFLIFCGAAAFASLALFTRQPLIIAYILLGAILGPYGLEWVHDTELLSDTSHIGIIFLLFLIGLDLNPKTFLSLVKKSSLVVGISSIIFVSIGYILGTASGFTTIESLIIGASLCFSSTIVGIKLLPTTVLHHKHVGELVVSLLLMQDLLAVLLLVAMASFASGNIEATQVVGICLSLPLLGIFAFAFVKWVILPLLHLFDRFNEYIFLITIGWALGLAQLATLIGLSHEIGGFIAGIALAQSPIAQYITDQLKPLRDFFLILFFFTLGAGFNTDMLSAIWLPAMSLALLVIFLKPFVYTILLSYFKEPKDTAQEVAIRLGQTSEFSLLIAYLGLNSFILSETASLVIQATTIITFVLSSYLVVFKYPTPIAISDQLRRD